jgi:hypothetical protein
MPPRTNLSTSRALLIVFYAAIFNMFRSQPARPLSAFYPLTPQASRQLPHPWGGGALCRSRRPRSPPAIDQTSCVMEVCCTSPLIAWFIANRERTVPPDRPRGGPPFLGAGAACPCGRGFLTGNVLNLRLRGQSWRDCLRPPPRASCYPARYPRRKFARSISAAPPAARSSLVPRAAVEPDQSTPFIELPVEIVLSTPAGHIEAIFVTANDFEFTIWHAGKAAIGEQAIAGLERFENGPSALLDATRNAPFAISFFRRYLIHGSPSNRSGGRIKTN